MSTTATVDYDECIHATPEAVLLRIDDTELWVPRSVIVDEEPEPDSGPGSVEIAD